MTEHAPMYVHPGLRQQRDEAEAALREARVGLQPWQDTDESNRALAFLDEIDRAIAESRRIMDIQGRLVDENLAFMHKQHQWQEMERNGTASLYDMRAFFGLPPLTDEQIDARKRAVYAHEVKW